ncbi:NUDIX hydrolase domain-like protein [Apiospora arundinis]|uniref:NUDIX hydrolase domain-like protein n=1 Tax=Apiospora arundinis TaxID=335852 RepID=A0ABR2IID1_9PEZI
MLDEAFLHGLLRDAAQSFASKAEETRMAKMPDGLVSQNSITRPSASSADTETPDSNKKVNQMSITATTDSVVTTTPTKAHQDTRAMMKTSHLNRLASSNSKEDMKIPCGFPAFAYTDAVAVFFIHHLFFRGPQATTDYDRLAAGAIVFNRDGDKVLLVQRAGVDRLAGKWETPGGKCANRDMTILHGLVRDVYEGTYKLLTCKGGDSGLVANGIVTTTGYHELMSPSNQRCRKYVFVVEVDTWAVSLDPEKYARCVWASERDIVEGWCEEHELEFAGVEECHHIIRAFKAMAKGKEDDRETEALSSTARKIDVV